MAKEIAAFIDEKGLATPLPDAAYLQVYRKQENVWRQGRSLKVALGQARGLGELRSRMAEIIEFLVPCNTVVAESFQGAALHALEKANVGMWEISGRPEASFDSILAEEEASLHENKEPMKIPFPILENRGDGRVYISIVDVQRSGGGITSKQVLMPLLHQASFKELEILCAHLPPWLEAEVARRHWQYIIKKTPEQHALLTINVADLKP
jgi:Fe-only nitrogenase accessory protein AnfO